MQLRRNILLCFVGVIITSMVYNSTFGSVTLTHEMKQAAELYTQALIESDVNTKERLLSKAFQLDSNNNKLSFLYGKVLLKLKKVTKATRILSNATKDPKLGVRVCRHLGEHFYRNADYVNANIYFKKAIKLKKGQDFLSYYRLGEINNEKGLKNYSDSIKFYLKAYDLRKSKDNKDILLLVAENYYYISEYKKAITYLKRYPHANQNNQSAFKLLINAYDKSENKKELKRQVNKYLRVWPYDKWARKIANKVSMN